MSRDLRVGLQVELEDRGATNRARQVSRVIERESEKASRQSVRMADQAAQGQERASQRERRAAQRMFQDRERLGIRSEQRIRREIQLTEAAYQRLTRTGRLTANEQARAFQSAQQRIQTLRREIEAVNRVQGQGPIGRGMSLAGRGLQAYQGAAGATVAAGYVMAQPVTRSMSWDRRMAEMSNTAYAERDLAGRQAGARTLSNNVRDAVRAGGGSRDSAADALDAMLASGAVSESTATGLLPSLQRSSTATGASSVELANIALQALQFGIKESDIPLALDMATKAGQLGGFEVKDMARWLPQQLAAGGAAGMSGLNDFASLLAANQAARRTAGTADEAGNNVVNFLQKLTSQDLANAAKKVEISPGKSIDLIGTLNAARENGVDPIEAFGRIVDKVMAGDKRYQAAQKAMADTTRPEERRAIAESQAALVQGSVIGSLLADRQAWSGFLGIYNNGGYRREVLAGTMDAAGTNDRNFDLIAATNSFQVERAKNAALFAEGDGMQGINGLVASGAGRFADLATEFPSMTAAVISAGNALNALAAAAGAAMVIGTLRGRSGAGAIARGAGAAAAGGAAAASGRGVGGALARGSGAVAAGVGAMGIWNAATGSSEGRAGEVAEAVTSAGGMVGGSLAGAKAGAVAGPWGAAVGGVAGGLLGGWIGDELGAFLKAHMSAPRDVQAEMAASPNAATAGMSAADLQAAILAARQPQELKVTVSVQDGNIVAAVNAANAREARRN